MLDLVIGIATDFGCLSKNFTDLTVEKLKSLQLKSFTVADAHLFWKKIVPIFKNKKLFPKH